MHSDSKHWKCSTLNLWIPEMMSTIQNEKLAVESFDDEILKWKKRIPLECDFFRKHISFVNVFFWNSKISNSKIQNSKRLSSLKIWNTGSTSLMFWTRKKLNSHQIKLIRNIKYVYKIMGSSSSPFQNMPRDRGEQVFVSKFTIPVV